MRARAAIGLGLLVASVLATSCAQILSYDDYGARPSNDAPVDAGLDAPIDAPPDAPPSDAPDGGAEEPPARVPARPAGPAEPSGTGKTLWLVVDHFYLGQDDPEGGLAKDPWRKVGLDLDQVCTTEKLARENIGTCRRNAEAAQDVLTDGDGCRDNNFGSHVVKLVGSFDASFEKKSNALVAKGSTTWLLKLEDLDDGSDDPYVAGKLYKAATWADYGTTTPKFDGTDVRDVDATSVDDFDLEKPKVVFPKGYLAGDTWVSGEPSTFEANVPIQGLSVVMPLVAGLVSMQLDEAHTKVVRGVIGGAIAATTLESVVRPIADQAGLCPGDALYDSLLRNIMRTVDVAVGVPGLQSPALPCDGLSIGIGFSMVQAQPPTKVATSGATPTRCGDAGGS